MGSLMVAIGPFAMRVASKRFTLVSIVGRHAIEGPVDFVRHLADDLEVEQVRFHAARSIDALEHGNGRKSHATSNG
jgi:hypothetical protein